MKWICWSDDLQFPSEFDSELLSQQWHSMPRVHRPVHRQLADCWMQEKQSTRYTADFPGYFSKLCFDVVTILRSCWLQCIASPPWTGGPMAAQSKDSEISAKMRVTSFLAPSSTPKSKKRSYRLPAQANRAIVACGWIFILRVFDDIRASLRQCSGTQFSKELGIVFLFVWKKLDGKGAMAWKIRR
jgi:hypothetical protein